MVIKSGEMMMVMMRKRKKTRRRRRQKEEGVEKEDRMGKNRRRYKTELRAM